MYYRYFGLDQPPFRITPDTRLFFPGGNRGAVLEALIYAIASGEGIVKVVGEVGSGKTMLCRMLEEQLPENVEVVYLANPNLSPDDILHAIALELKLPLTAGESRLDLMQKLQQFLLEKHAANRRVVAFIEEAQGMPLATLEEIRLLSNLETKVDKLLQIVLFGQPELDQRLAAHEIRQLRDRVTYSFALEPLPTDAIRDYLVSRLRASGARSTDLFAPAAVRAIARRSAGLLRRINILADKAMLAAYADNASQIAAKHVKRAASDGESAGALKRRKGWLAAFVAGVVTMVLALLGWRWMNGQGEPTLALATVPPMAPATVITESTAPPLRALPQPGANSVPAVAAQTSVRAVTAPGTQPSAGVDADGIDLTPRLSIERILELAAETPVTVSPAAPERAPP